MCYIRDITPNSRFEVFPLEVIQTRLQMDVHKEQQRKRVSQWNPKPLPEFTQTSVQMYKYGTTEEKNVPVSRWY